MWWLDTVGILDEMVDPVAGFEATRSQVSLQLVGRPDRSTLDLSVLRNRGIRLVGRAVAGEGATVRFANDLAASTTAADFRLARLLARIGGFITGRAGPHCRRLIR
jgi:putative flavoprotein involved in K+ transport